MLKALPFFTLLFLGISCSKSSTSSLGKTVGTLIDAQFIDDPVKGLSFETSSGTGKTATQGLFKCSKGEKVTFKICGLELGHAICGEKIFVDDLISDKIGYSPEKVAAIIQSFAVAGSNEFDLSAAMEAMPSEALADFSFAGDDISFKTALENKVAEIESDIPELSFIIEAKDPADMRSLLDAALSTYSNISEILITILGLQSVNSDNSYSDLESTGKLITITGELIDSSGVMAETCYKFMQARLSVTQESVEKPYKLIINRMAVFNGTEDYNQESNRCRSEFAACDDDTITMFLPAPKTITSDSINFLMTAQMDDLIWENKTLLKASLVEESLKFSGTFEQIWRWTGSPSSSCKYEITSEEVNIPAAS